MKIYEIRNKHTVYGYFFYEDDDNYYIEIVDGLPSYPVFFNEFVKKNTYIINSYWTLKWINERVIPYSRQNINSILKENNMTRYNEIEMLIKSMGKSSMDDNYLKCIKESEICDSIRKRREKTIKDIMPISNDKIIIFYNDGKTTINEIKQEGTPFITALRNELIYDFKNRFNYLDLYNSGENISFLYTDLIKYLDNNLMDVKAVKDEKNITRQNVYNLKKKDNIIGLKYNLFLKNNIL